MSNTNSVKNTLFRFNTLRAPQLIDPSKKPYLAAMHPNIGASAFAEPINNPLNDKGKQLDALRNCANEFTAIASEDALNELLGSDFVAFANLVVTNKQKLAVRDEATATKTIMVSFPLGEHVINQLWDNLFYQIVTQANPALRERIMDAILANHFAKFCNKEEKTYEPEAALSVVVLPTSFYGNPQTTLGAETTPANTVPVASASLQKDANAVLYKAKLEQVEKTALAFQQAEKKWRKDNQAAFETAKASYDENLRTRFSEIENARPVPPAQKEGEMLVDNSLVKEGENTNDFVEPFVFTSLPQVNTDTLRNLLSPEAAFIANQLDLSSLSTFEEVQDKLAAEAKLLTEKLFQFATLSTKKVAIGDRILSLDDDGGAAPNARKYTYVIIPYALRDNVYKFFLTIQMGETNTSAVAADYSAGAGRSSLGSSKSFTTSSVRQNLMVELFADGLNISAGTTNISLQGYIQTNAGLKLSFNSTVPLADRATGVMGVDYGDGNDDTNDGTGDITEDSTFIPSGFGIKRLGIADYKKVEQSICCYVPGEVSHIENIMASEYKERSTRRLRRSEETNTTETQVEKENQTDTTSTDRYELQQETASVLNQNTSTSASSNATFKIFNSGSMGINASFANNVSQQQSDKQSVHYAKEVTQKALEKVVQRVRQERVTKIMDEFEENNKHGFDNRKGPKHVSGVYRWVDKVYKNQVLNYGKRLMYEFMIPQPAVFHQEAMKQGSQSNNLQVLEKPIDPRSEAAGLHAISSHKAINAANYHIWAGIYNAEVEAPPVAIRYIGKSFSTKASAPGAFEVISDGTNSTIKIPDGYKAVSAQVQLSGMPDGNTGRGKGFGIGIGNLQFDYPHIRDWHVFSTEVPLQQFVEEIPFAAHFCSFHSGQATASVKLEVLPEFVEQWQLKTFNAIIDSYQKKQEAYLESLKTVSESSKTTNPGFYRQIETTVLRKNCVTYLVGQNNLGKKWYSGTGVQGLQPVVNDKMDKYASLARFIEDAFEWETMGYNFLPFYWGNKEQWQNMYQQDVDDALFRSFLQAGFAKVIVPVRPGFEQAIMHYMTSGQVWNGGQVPVIGDDLYLSIVDELKNPEYVIEETWETKVPSSLTVIQASSIGLNTQGLPCDCGGSNAIANNDATLGVVFTEEKKTE